MPGSNCSRKTSDLKCDLFDLLQERCHTGNDKSNESLIDSSFNKMPSCQGMRQRSAIDVFKLSANRHTMRNAATLDLLT